jgi:IMP dehydrogenase
VDRPPFDPPLALTYDDVLLTPQRSHVASRADVSTRTRLTRGIELAAPIVAANMETVCEDRMAIAMARAGGIGVIHRFLTIERQVNEVGRVKRAEGFVVDEPWKLHAGATVAEARAMMREHGPSGLLLVDGEGRLQGIFTQRDLSAAGSDDEPAEAYATPRERLVTAEPGITLDEARAILHRHRIEKLPLADAGGALRGLITLRDIDALRDRPHASKDARGRLLVAAAVGVRGDYIERAQALVGAGCDALVLDIAHGHADHALRAVELLRESLPAGTQLVAGNVATAEGTDDLCRAGADGVKVGVGPGSACTTRIVAGVGVPQLTAVIACARAAEAHGVPVIADGGIRVAGDVAKAIAAGASTVMVGNLLAGTDESPGSVVTRDGKRYKVYRGMASAEAARRRAEAEGVAITQAVPEGVEAVVPYRGEAGDIVRTLVGGLRSAMSYSDAATIEDFHGKARFVRITHAGLIESMPHDVTMG